MLRSSPGHELDSRPSLTHVQLTHDAMQHAPALQMLECHRPHTYLSPFPPPRQDAEAIKAAMRQFAAEKRHRGEQLILHEIYASQYEAPSASVFRLVPAKPTLPYWLTAILADPYLSTFPDCSVRSCLYMVDLIMITAPHDQTPSIPTTPPTLRTQLRPLEAAARAPS